MLRIGSANLNNRSMGMDTERDFAIEAARAPNEAEVRRGIADFRDDLLAEHLGVSAKALARTIAEKGSVARAIDALNGVSQRQLRFFRRTTPEPARSGGAQRADGSAQAARTRRASRQWQARAGFRCDPVAYRARDVRPPRDPLERRAPEFDRRHKPR